MIDVPIKTALLSVSDKTGLVEFAQFLATQNVVLLSTGGTAKALRDAGLKVTEVSEHTGFPEMLDGRVKTLHPKIHGGLLGRRDLPEHAKAMAAHGIVPIDLVVVNLYPFEATLKRGASEEECIENIDIGGPSMLRSAAKNFAAVTVLTDPADYALVTEEMKTHQGATTLPTRRRLSGKAYARTAAYDSAIQTWFSRSAGETFPATLTLAATRKQELRYGENPHQKAAFYVTADAGPGVATACQLQGKELSYNNLNDTDAAFALVSEFADPALAIIKHANPCGVATGADVLSAYKSALACDPVSAFGGIIALNRALDAKTAEEISKLFAEVIIAPEADQAAQEIIAKKKNLRLLVTGAMPDPTQAGWMLKSAEGGFLLQDKDNGRISRNQCKAVTARMPTEEEWRDMLFAFTVAKHVKSNAIVLAKGDATIGIGAGQMSRVDSTRIACWKAEEAKLSTKGAVLASDAFFPFSDNVEAAAKAGIRAIIQPGGSIRDQEVIDAANAHGMAMVFTSMRHFRH
jgi:phosphoribosylaminoimidazolecarboxamide formyltransferase/IMP cyclohydrolase